MNRRRPMPRATARPAGRNTVNAANLAHARTRRPTATARPGTVRGGKKIVNVAPTVAPQTRRQRKQTGRKTSTAAVTGAGGQNRTVAVGKRAAPTNKTAAAKKTRKPLTRAASRRRERAIERTAQQQQRVQQRAQRRAANQARRAANRQARVARRTR